MPKLCQVCGKLRDDGDLEVFAYFPKSTSDGTGEERKIAYCADDSACFEGAEEKAAAEKT